MYRHGKTSTDKVKCQLVLH